MQGVLNALSAAAVLILAPIVDLQAATVYRVADCKPSAQGEMVQIEAAHVPADRVLRDLMRAKHLQVGHAELIGSTMVSFHFPDCIEVLALLNVLAGESAATVQQDKDGNFRFERQPEALAASGSVAAAEVSPAADEVPVRPRKPKPVARDPSGLQRVPPPPPVPPPPAWQVLAVKGQSLSRQGDTEGAIAVGKQALDAAEKSKEWNDPDSVYYDPSFVAGVQTNLANWYIVSNRYALAEALLESARKTEEAVAGANGPSLDAEQAKVAEAHRGTTLLVSAQWHRTQDQFDQAEAFYRRALALREKTHGKASLDVAAVLDAYGDMERARAHFEQAETMFKRALAIREQALGRDDPAVATTLEDLTAVYDAQPTFAQSEPLYKRMLAIREKALGPDDLTVAITLNNLGLLYLRQKRYAEAEPIYKRALAIMDKQLEPNDPMLATTLQSMVSLYEATGRKSEAAALRQRVAAVHARGN
jgi:tetratricopeptide (TPR) repeat protein